MLLETMVETYEQVKSTVWHLLTPDMTIEQIAVVISQHFALPAAIWLQLGYPQRLKNELCQQSPSIIGIVVCFVGAVCLIVAARFVK